MPWCCSCFAKTYEAPEVLELDYRHSSLTEVPPDVFTYERTLEKLDLGCNQISDLPPSLFHCHELRELDLCDNDLVTIPAAIGSLTRLSRLDLSRNAISEIADTIKNCKNLTYLDLSLNHLQKLPEGISQLVNLEELFLNDTYLEFLHANFGRLTKLKVLELRENSLQTLPKSMNRLHNLQRIDIGQNDISEMPEVIGTMTSLVEIWCDNNSIRVIPKIIGNLTKLNCLDASQNEIQEISEDISKCSQLSDLTLANNSLESLPDSFPKLENLTVLRLDSNSIQYLPEDFGNLKSLQELSLIRNLLKSLPASVGLMRKLRTLYLDDNLLTELPKEIGSCSALSILSAAKNRLTSIPSEVGHLSNLKVLTVAGNLLVNLPVSIFNIRELDALWLSESQSKPLLPLTKEVDPTTGQHVLTCYLLPQLSSAQTEAQMAMEENKLPQRRSRPSIKFVTDAEPQPTETNLSKRGLLRAPTPYPKELRALAKHASHLRSKDQNGDVIINDEPEYEGDYAEHDSYQEGSRGENYSVKALNNGGVLYQHQYQKLPALPKKDYAENDEVDNRRSYDSDHAIPGPQTPLLPATVERILSSIEEANKRSQDSAMQMYPSQTTNISLIDPCPVVSEASAFPKHSLVQEDAKKGPPPYHVAAMRAAMFRSSGPSSSSSGSPLGLPPVMTSYDPQNVNATPASTSQYDGEPQHTYVNSHAAPTTLTAPPLPIPNIPDTQYTASSFLNNHSVAIERGDMVDGTREGSPRDLLQLGRGDGSWNDTKQLNNEQCKISEKESRVIEKLIESSNQLQRQCVEESRIINQEEITPTDHHKVDHNDQHINNSVPLTREERIVSDLISTIEMSLHNNKDDDGHMACQQVPGRGSSEVSSDVRKDPSSGETANANNDENGHGIVTNGVSKIISPSIQQEESSSVQAPTFTANTSLSSSESFSKIPKFSTSKLPAPPSTAGPAVVDYDKVPSSNNSASSSKPAVGNLSRISTPSSSSNICSTSPGSSTNWSKIPKLPTKNSPAVSSELKKPETAPKPTLTRIASGSRIPAVNADPPRTAPKPTAFRSTNPPLTSPTGSGSRIPRVGDHQQQPQVLANNQSQRKEEEHKALESSHRNQLQSQQQNHTQQSHGYQEPGKQPEARLERIPSGSRIPKFGKQGVESEQPKQRIIEATIPVQTSAEPPAVTPTGMSKIPTVGGRKPWIFGTHRNARVVPVEYTKVNSLGFTVTNGPMVPNASEGSGIFVDSVEEVDSGVKVGDKILQVDGIDVSNMGIEIVRKILSNCQENIHLLVSRHY